MEDIFLKQEQTETSVRMDEIFDRLIPDTTALDNSHASSDKESTKELAVVKLIDSDYTTREIVSSLKGSQYEQQLRKIFPEEESEETIVQRKQKKIPISKRLILLPNSHESQSVDDTKKFTLILLDKENGLPFQIIGEQELSLSGVVKDSCQKVVNLQKVQLQEITDKLVKNSF